MQLFFVKMVSTVRDLLAGIQWLKMVTAELLAA